MMIVLFFFFESLTRRLGVESKEYCHSWEYYKKRGVKLLEKMKKNSDVFWKTSEKIWKISDVFWKISDVFGEISDVLEQGKDRE